MTDQPNEFRVDLTNCDREPIHLLGHIQSSGFLVAVSADWLIQHVSANIGDFFDREPASLPGEPLASLLPPPTIYAIRSRLQMLASSDGTERIFGTELVPGGRRFDVAVHVSGQSIVIEAEPADTEQASNPGALVKSMVARVQKTASLDALFRECVRQLRGLTGFDRVMLYRFAADGAGAVVAESARGDLETFLGLNYPASDIPAQARALYIRNPIRIIANVADTPVPVIPARDVHGQPLDLSLSVLRSVSPIHIEYLSNMGVNASMSISIVIDGQLWGLFALHHYEPRHLSMELRSAAELFGQMVSLVIEGRLYKERRMMEEAARDLHDRFIGKIVATTANIEALADFGDELQEIIPSDGFCVFVKGEAKCFGRCPDADEIRGLARFLNRAAASKIYTSDQLAAVYPEAEAFEAKAAGVLAIPISRAPRDYLMFFRKELVETVHWAGKPEKQTVLGPNGPRLTPRKSFELWQETVRGKCKAWSESERKAAEALRVSILEVLLHFNEENERYRSQATARQELLIAELNHRVRNILSLIRALVVQSKPSAVSVDEFARIIGGRIQALARAHDQITNEDFADTLLADIIRTEVSAYVGNKAERVHLNGPAIVVEAAAFSTLALVFHELVTNSAKYGALSDSHGYITVNWRIDEHDNCRIDWVESGGPAVTAPTRRGFGSTIIERSIPHDLGGAAELRYLLPGLNAHFTLPASVYSMQKPRTSHPSKARPHDPDDLMPPAEEALKGLTGLLVEDNMIISLDAEQIMRDQGMASVFIAASVSDARAVIEREAVDLALLDVNLGHETSFSLIGTLKARGIPFIFASGYGEQLELPPEAAGATMVKKPFSAVDLVKALVDARSKATTPAA